MIFSFLHNSRVVTTLPDAPSLADSTCPLLCPCVRWCPPPNAVPAAVPADFVGSQCLAFHDEGDETDAAGGGRGGGAYRPAECDDYDSIY